MSHTPPPGVPIRPEPAALVPAPPITALTNRELEVATALAYGLTNREIADTCRISIKTVDTHRGHVLKKLKLKNNVALARFMLQHGLVKP